MTCVSSSASLRAPPINSGNLFHLNDRERALNGRRDRGGRPVPGWSEGRSPARCGGEDYVAVIWRPQVESHFLPCSAAALAVAVDRHGAARGVVAPGPAEVRGTPAFVLGESAQLLQRKPRDAHPRLRRHRAQFVMPERWRRRPPRLIRGTRRSLNWRHRHQADPPADVRRRAGCRVARRGRAGDDGGRLQRRGFTRLAAARATRSAHVRRFAAPGSAGRHVRSVRPGLRGRGRGAPAPICCATRCRHHSYQPEGLRPGWPSPAAGGNAVRLCLPAFLALLGAPPARLPRWRCRRRRAAGGAGALTLFQQGAVCCRPARCCASMVRDISRWSARRSSGSSE